VTVTDGGGLTANTTVNIKFTPLTTTTTTTTTDRPLDAMEKADNIAWMVPACIAAAGLVGIGSFVAYRYGYKRY
jgi:hypothetical protein